MPLSTNESSLIEFCDVSKKFGEKLSVKNVSFSVKKHNLTTLIGPNGAGKTTIARLILGLEKPTSGKIIISPGLKIGYVPQKINHVDLPITVGSFLDLMIPKRLDNICKETLDFIDLDAIINQDIYKLSGGQFQKLILSATVLNNPDLIILDEPTQSLDVASQQEFYQIIHHLRQKHKMSIFMISHDLFTVMKNSDQVICLNGHVCCSGMPQDLVNNQEFRDILSSVGFYMHHHDHKH